MEKNNNGKIHRILGLYTKLLNGGVVSKDVEAGNYQVNERSIQRDLEDIRAFFKADAKDGEEKKLVYDRSQKGYHLGNGETFCFTDNEMMMICKILLESRAFSKKDMVSILNRLVSCCAVKEKRDELAAYVEKEQKHYVEPRKQSLLMNRMWEIDQAITAGRYIEIEYMKRDGVLVKQRIKPIGITFSEYSFHLKAYNEGKARQDVSVINELFPTMYRIDKIKNMKVLDEFFVSA